MKKIKTRALFAAGLILIVVFGFMALSLSDVLRLNPELEGTSYFQMTNTAKSTSIDKAVNVVIAAAEVPEDTEASFTAEKPVDLSVASSLTLDSAEYQLLTYEDFKSFGGKFSKDKFGEFKTVSDGENVYNLGTVHETGVLYERLGTWERVVIFAAWLYTPAVILGCAMILLALAAKTIQDADTNQRTVNEQLLEVAGPKKMRRIISDNAIIVGIVLLSIYVSIMRPNFLSEANFRNLLANTAVRFIIAVGVSGCLITKGTDLSAGRMTGFAACLSAIFLQRAGTYASKFYPDMGELPVLPILLGVLAICAVLGALNGSIIAVFKVPPFIATLGMQTLIYGVCLVYTGAQPIGNLQAAYTNIALGYVGNRMFSYIALIALVVGLYMWFLYNKTRHGKYMYAIGGNETAAEVAGINTTKMKIRIYTLAAVMYGLTGFLMAAKSGGASVNTAQGYELEAIAGCTIGGVSVNGGVGRISGILIGVLVFELLKIALQFLGVDSSYTYIAQGLVIIIAVALDLRKYLAKK
jgi:methyl-galactoside transport system permease protein